MRNRNAFVVATVGVLAMAAGSLAFQPGTAPKADPKTDPKTSPRQHRLASPANEAAVADRAVVREQKAASVAATSKAP
jgi:hypothetical protein